MALFVQKFGGTSLATLEHINHAADIVAKARQFGHRIVVIVSAMSGETDKLIGFAHNISESPDEREYAALVSTGEQVSMALMTMALINRGIKARSYTGSQAGIQTCNQFKKARIETINTAPILNDLEQGLVVVIAGFQGVDKAGNITTLGRGGSDTTAVAIAAALNADECQIYTDVDGVYTTDPRIVPEAKRLESISFEEMLELSSLGAKVLQIRAVEFAGKYNIPLRVLSSSEEGPGTLITYQQDGKMETPSVIGIAYSRSEAKIMLKGIPNAIGIASIILTETNAIGVNIDMIMQYPSTQQCSDFAFTVHSDDYQTTLAKLDPIVKTLGAQRLEGMTCLAKLSLVGAGLKSHPEVVLKMFSALAAKSIHVQSISTSEIKISVLLSADQLEEGVKALHTAFHLDGQSTEEYKKASLSVEPNALYAAVRKRG